MKLSLPILGVALIFLVLTAGCAMAGPAPKEKAAPPAQQQSDGVTKASRAAEKKIEEALKGRSMARTAADMAITAKVKTALIEDASVSASDINVDTLNGVVYLRGTARNKAEAQKAFAIARKTFGVKGVKNYLKVVSSGTAPVHGEKRQPAASGKKTR